MFASDLGGNRTALYTSGTGHATAWGYSSAGRITSVSDLRASTSRTYGYDPADDPAAVTSITNPDIPAILAVAAEPPSEAHPDGVPEVLAVASVPVAADTFTYDDLGRMIGRVTHEVNTSTRTVATHTLALTWDASSNLVKTDLDGKSVVYVYDSSGQRVAQIGVTAATATAYLGATEVTDPNTAVNATDPADLVGTTYISATRYYSLGGATVAVREAPTTASPTDKLSFLFGDVQGSAQVMVTHTVDPSTGALSAITAESVHRNAYTPYGSTRGTGTVAQNDDLSISKGWLNQVSDEASTGLVYLNARYYDPVVARFISPDPLMDPSDPRTLDPHRYAENNPITYSDASGLGPVCTGLTGTALDNCNAYGNKTANYMTGETKVARAIAKIVANAQAKAKAKSGMGPGGGRCTNYACVVENLMDQGAYNPGTYVNIQPVTNDGNLDWVDVSNSPPVTQTESGRAYISVGLVILAVAAVVCTFASPVCVALGGTGAALGARAATAEVSAARVFVSTDPYVAGAANAIERAMPGRVFGVNANVRMFNGLSREVDIDLGNVLVQVKGGSARGLTGQIASTQATTGKIVVGYAPDMPGQAWEVAAQQGVAIARTPSELIAILEEVG